MTYDNLHADFEKLFPESTAVLHQLAQDASAEPSDGMHIMFSFVVMPFVIGLLEKDDKEGLTKAFQFFEEMASSDFTDVAEVVEFSVIESLMNEETAIYQKAKTWMGEQTLECSNYLEQFMRL